ncbi:relA/SpoT family protein, partial [Vibrio parahaemolyticus V-223/04]
TAINRFTLPWLAHTVCLLKFRSVLKIWIKWRTKVSQLTGLIKTRAISRARPHK